MDPKISPMQPSDIEGVDDIWQQAFGALRAASPNPSPPRTDEAEVTDRKRFAHLLRSDPEGCVVARLDGGLVGFAQSLVREGTFVLAMLGVQPEFQDRGVGAALLTRALGYSEGCRAQYIFSSTDPRALHRYVRAGFALHPTVAVTSRPAGGPVPAPGLRLSQGGEEDVARVEEIDRAVRGSARRGDVEFWLSAGQRLVLDERGAYAVVGNGRLAALGATSETLAHSLLAALLHGYPDGEVLELSWIAAEQAWAIETAADCHAMLRVAGAIMTRGIRSLPVPYLPNGLFG